MVPLLYAVFFLSGAAALVYEVVWVRSLSLVFGGSHLAVTTVLSVFMGGLALGRPPRPPPGALPPARDRARRGALARPALVRLVPRPLLPPGAAARPDT